MSCVNQTEAFFDIIEAFFDAIEVPFDPVDAASLACDLRLQMPDLNHDMSHRGLKRGNTRLNLDHFGFKLVDAAPYMPQMFKDDIVGLVSHDVTLANSKSHHHPVV